MKKSAGSSMMKKSVPNKFAVGSGSRPSGGKVAIPTSEPKKPHGLGRKPANALK